MSFILEAEPNNLFSIVQIIEDIFFSQNFVADIQDIQGNNISRIYDHVTISGTGNFDPNDNIEQKDYYSFNVDAGTSLILDIDDNNGDPFLILYDPERNVVATSEDDLEIGHTGGEKASFITHSATVSGNYTVLVVGDPNSNSSVYTLHISKLKPAAVAPNDIVIDNTIIPELQAIGYEIGSLSTSDGNLSESFAYSLVPGDGDKDNQFFSIDGNILKSNTIFDYESKNEYNIRIRTTDSSGLSYEKLLIISVTDIDENAFYKGALDQAFGVGGVAIVPFSGSIAGLEVQSDGRIVIGGTFNGDFGAIRLTKNGAVDNSFGGGDGFVSTDIEARDFARSMALQADDKILVAGGAAITSDQQDAIVRYNIDGTLDTTFNNSGIRTLNVEGFGDISLIAVNQDGTIVTLSTLSRYTGFVNRPIEFLTIVNLYDSNGSLISEGEAGSIPRDQIDQVLEAKNNKVSSQVLQEDGSLLVANINNGVIEVSRYLGDVFEPAQYCASNPDLIQFIGYQPADLTQHYLNFGRFESRSLDVFDEYRYIASNTDLIHAFGLNGSGATQHYITNGFGESRSLTAFIPSRYLLSQGDLLNAFDTNLQAAISHYITNGFAERRDPNFFQSDRYIASHPDLIQAYRYNLEAGSNHYLFSGRGERRQITFSPEAYLSRYGDLQAAFGNDLATTTRHYIEYGFGEGRTWS
jgi:uncharacterized delta-60 repeat protein